MNVRIEIIGGRFAFTRFSGLLCAIIGLVVVILNCAMPEKMKEVFGVGSVDDEDDEDATHGEGHLSSVFPDDLTISAFASKVRLVSWG